MAMKYGLALPYNSTKLVAEAAHLAEESGGTAFFWAMLSGARPP